MKKTVAVLLLCVMLIGIMPIFAENTQVGQRFTAADRYCTTSVPESAPKTFEAWIKVDKNASSDRLGIIVGNFGGPDSKSSVNFEIRTNGNPYLWWNAADKSGAKTVAFTNVDLRTGEKLHLAIALTKDSASCYVNGELKQSASISLPDIPKDKMNNFAIGGDFRDGNVQYLKSAELYSTALFSDTRSAAQIKSDMNAFSKSVSLLFAYDMTAKGKDRLGDISDNGNHLVYTNSSDPSKNETFIEYEDITDGLAFAVKDSTYKMDGTLENVPLTLEASICFPHTFAQSERGGVIVGNYGGSSASCINFEIFSGGVPRFYWVDPNGKIHDHKFTKVNVCNGEWNHIAITIDGNTLSCYLNGELVQTLTVDTVPKEVCTLPMIVGGDYRSGNAQNFKGRIRSLALYSDVRTAEEIKSDVNTLDKSSLVAAYDFSDVSGDAQPEKFNDLSENSYTLELNVNETWMDTFEEPNDYAYSFAVVGDTQIVTEKYPENLADIYDWIVANKESKNIQFVMGLGDITNSDTPEEWMLAKINIAKLNEVVPYSLVRGNHDSSAKFTNAFSGGKYLSYLEGRYNESLENTWQELIIGKTKYIIMTLDYGANDSVLAWAGEVISSHPEHNVIITTHAYLFRDGTTLDSGDVCPPTTSGGHNNGDHMWDKLISRHKNITLVLSGHDPCDRVVVTQTEGVHGNVVTQMLIDPQGVDAAQGATGLVAMLYFSEDGKDVTVRYYSTVRDQYFMSDNQFTMKIDNLNEDIPESKPDSGNDNGENKDPENNLDNGENNKDNTKKDHKGTVIAVASVSIILVLIAVVAAAVVKAKKKKA